MNTENLIRPHIKSMPAYKPVLPFHVRSQQLGIPIADIIKLDANENPFGVLPAVQDALANLPFAHIYPDPEARQLSSALSDYLGVPAENLLAGAGADELIDLIMRLFLEPNDTIIDCPPTFGMYKFDALLNAGQVIQVERNTDFSLDVEAVKNAVRDHAPKLLFLTNPNNPSGNLIPRADLDELLKLPVMVVVDEAYVEFSPDGTSLIQEVAQRDNLIILRTFSKLAGLAGLRIGYGAFPTALMPHLWKIKQPYNISVAAETAATVAVNHAHELEAQVDLLVAEREKLCQALSEITYLNPYPSHSNFVLCQVVGKDAAQLQKDLAKHGILIRYFNKKGLDDHIRISVGTPDQMKKVIKVLKLL